MPHAVGSEGDKVEGETHEQTGVPCLDEILGGGLPRGSLILVMGLPGSGKTTLASQIGCWAAKNGKTTLILTALSESTGKLIDHLRAFAFFDPALIGGPVQFLSLQSVLSQGLETTATAIISEVRRVKADMLILDGFRGMRSVDAEPQAAREFLYHVGTSLGALGVTTIVTSETDPRDPTFFPETTTADVIIGLHYTLLGVRQMRGIEILKARGAAPLPGLHALTLGPQGASVYPQLEARVAAKLLGGEAQTQGAAPLPARAQSTEQAASLPGGARRSDAASGAAAVSWTPTRIGFASPELDQMLAGGLPEGTCTVLAGSMGTGKTLLAMQYSVAGTRAGEPIVFLGFRESREHLRRAAAPFDIGPDLARAIEEGGKLHFIETPPVKVNADVLADRLLRALDETGAQRLVIDSIAELERALLRSADPQRLEDYLAALLQALRSRRVTSLLLKETDKAMAATLDFSADPLSVLAENVVLLQRVPYEGRLHRIVSVLKERFSDPDSSLREFTITAPQGFRVLERFESATGALEGVNRVQEAHVNDTRRKRAGSGLSAERGTNSDA